MLQLLSFKPYYNWNTFNTYEMQVHHSKSYDSFKPYYNWNTFNTEIISWAEENGIEF